MWRDRLTSFPRCDRRGLRHVGRCGDACCEGRAAAKASISIAILSRRIAAAILAVIAAVVLTWPIPAHACQTRLVEVAHSDSGCEAVVGVIGPIASLGIDDGTEAAPVPLAAGQLQLADSAGFGVQVVTRLGPQSLSHADVLWLQAAFVDQDRRHPPQALSAVAEPSPMLWAAAEPSMGLRLASGFLHYWLPTLRHSFFAGIGLIEAPRMALRAYGDGTSVATLGAGSQLVWSLADGVDLGLEVLYVGQRAFDRRRLGFMDIGLDGKVDARLHFRKEF